MKKLIVLFLLLATFTVAFPQLYATRFTYIEAPANDVDKARTLQDDEVFMPVDLDIELKVGAVGKFTWEYEGKTYKHLLDIIEINEDKDSYSMVSRISQSDFSYIDIKGRHMVVVIGKIDNEILKTYVFTIKLL